MLAALLENIGRPLSLADVPVPRVGADDVLVEARTCGICRTDLHIQDGLAYVPKLPHIPGHEPAGVVAEVGANVKGVRVGQRVAPHLFVRSAECEYTRAGHDAQATNLAGILGVTLPGGFAEFFVAPARNLLPLPDEVPFDIGGLTSCAVITAVHAFRLADLHAGETAVVLGAGGIGQILIQRLVAAGVRTIAISRSSESLKLATAAGAAPAISLDDADVVARVRAFAESDGGGAACVFELVGLARTMKLAGEMVMRRGKIVVIGEEAEYPAIDTIQIAQRELQILGSRNGSLDDAREAIRLMADGTLRPPIARRFPLAEINAAFDYVRRGAAHGRVIITVRE